MIYPFENPVRVSEDVIDCEIDHPIFGKLPFTCSRDEYPEMFAALEAALD